MVNGGLPPIAPARERRWLLALSGGGYRGLFTARVLEHLEREIGRPLNTVFDLIAGTSIGSILALGLASGVRVEEFVQLLKQDGGAIFPERSMIDRALALVRPRYSTLALKDALEGQFSSNTFESLTTAVLIPAVSLTDSGPAIFRTRAGSAAATSISLVDAALASSAAPTYFMPHRIGDQQYVDGGLIANSPDALALNEAMANHGWPLRTLSLLSVGTTSVETGLAYSPRNNWGILGWAWKGRLLEQMMSAQAKLSRDSAHRLLGDRFFSVDTVRSSDQDDHIALDRATPVATRTLLGLADAAWQRLHERNGQLLELLKLSHR